MAGWREVESFLQSRSGAAGIIFNERLDGGKNELVQCATGLQMPICKPTHFKKHVQVPSIHIIQLLRKQTLADVPIKSMFVCCHV